MIITVSINTDNAAFDDDPQQEVGRIMADAVDHLAHMIENKRLAFEELNLMDTYGNSVGFVSLRK